MANISEFITSYFEEQKTCLNQMVNEKNNVARIVEKLLNARDDEKKIFTIGNGGSASTASHFVSDLLKTGIIKDAKRFNAISLTDNIPVLLAWANDTSYEDIFIEQLKNYVKKDDIIISFSGSGQSKNVTKAMEYASSIGAFVIGFTGSPGGVFPKISDICITVPSSDMLTIESFHLVLCHVIISSIRNTGIPEFRYE